VVASAAAGFVFAKTQGAVTLDPTAISRIRYYNDFNLWCSTYSSSCTINPVGAASPVMADAGVAQEG
jgi:hypothetical protein